MLFQRQGMLRNPWQGLIQVLLRVLIPFLSRAFQWGLILRASCLGLVCLPKENDGPWRKNLTL